MIILKKCFRANRDQQLSIPETLAKSTKKCFRANLITRTRSKWYSCCLIPDRVTT